MPKNADDWKEIGERIKNARQYRGYSQQDIADYLEVSRSAVSLIENGERKIDSIELRKLARLFDTSIDELIGTPAPESDSREEVEMVARAAKELTPEDREEVLRFAEFLISRRSGSEDNG